MECVQSLPQHGKPLNQNLPFYTREEKNISITVQVGNSAFWQIAICKGVCFQYDITAYVFLNTLGLLLSKVSKFETLLAIY